MKFIKLDARYNLYRQGYRYAFKFASWSSEASRAEFAIRQLERGATTFWGKPNGRNQSRPYYIGVRNESTATMVMLKVSA